MLGATQLSLLKDASLDDPFSGVLTGCEDLGPEKQQYTIETNLAMRLIEMPRDGLVTKIVANIGDEGTLTGYSERCAGGIIFDESGNTVLGFTEVKLLPRTYQFFEVIMDPPVPVLAGTRYRIAMIADVGGGAPKISICDPTPTMLGQKISNNNRNMPVLPPEVWNPTPDATTSADLTTTANCPFLCAVVKY